MKKIHVSEIKKEQPSLEGTKKCTLQWLITEKDGAPHYAMRLFTLEPGGMIPVHTHDIIEHEIFIVEGTGILNDGNSDVNVQVGDAVFVKPGDKHSFRNNSDVPLRFICVIPIETTR